MTGLWYSNRCVRFLSGSVTGQNDFNGKPESEQLVPLTIRLSKFSKSGLTEPLQLCVLRGTLSLTTKLRAADPPTDRNCSRVTVVQLANAYYFFCSGPRQKTNTHTQQNCRLLCHCTSRQRRLILLRSILGLRVKCDVSRVGKFNNLRDCLFFSSFFFRGNFRPMLHHKMSSLLATRLPDSSFTTVFWRKRTLKSTRK